MDQLKIDISEILERLTEEQLWIAYLFLAHMEREN